jgi:large subunit ribosomal protein L4
MPTKDKAYETIMRSAGNLQGAKILLASYLNVRDVLGFEKVVLPLNVLDMLSTHLG